MLFPTAKSQLRISTLSLNLLKQVPLPNLPNNLYSFNPVQTEDVEQGLFRVDHTISNKDTIWGYALWQNTPVLHTLSFLGGTLPGNGESDISFSTQAVGQWTHTFNPTALNEFRVAFVRFNYKAVFPTNVELPSSLGFTGITPQFPDFASAPLISLLGYFNLGFSGNGPQPTVDNTYQIDDNFSKVIGTHTLKFGFDGRRYEVNNPFLNNNNGSFTFDGAGQYTTSDPGADFLLGIPDSYDQGSGGYQNFRSLRILPVHTGQLEGDEQSDAQLWAGLPDRYALDESAFRSGGQQLLPPRPAIHGVPNRTVRSADSPGIPAARPPAITSTTTISLPASALHTLPIGDRLAAAKPRNLSSAAASASTSTGRKKSWDSSSSAQYLFR